MKDKVYAQVYSMIRTFPQGLLKALELFSQVGYDGVELVGCNTEGMPVKEFCQYLKELHLTVRSVHSIGAAEDMDFANAIGARYMTVALDPAHQTRESLEAACRELDEQGRFYRSHGLKAVLHNHADEFRWVKGEEGKTRIYDILLAQTDPELVSFELDAGWAALAGADLLDPSSPQSGSGGLAAYIRSNPGRFPLIHVKECTKIAATPEEMEHFPSRIFHEGLKRDPKTNVPLLTEAMKQELYESRSWNGALGKGIIDWRALTSAADAQGCEAYVSEREYYHYEGSDGTNACCVQLDYDFLRSL